MHRFVPALFALLLLPSPAAAQFEQLIKDPDAIKDSVFAPPPPEPIPATAAAPPPLRLLVPSLHRDPIIHLDQSPDGRHLLTLDAHVLKVWDVATQAVIATYEQTPSGWNFNLPQAIMAAWFTAVPRQIVVCTNHQVYVFNDYDFSKSVLPRSTQEPLAYRFDQTSQTVHIVSYATDRYNQKTRFLTLGKVDLATGRTSTTGKIGFTNEVPASTALPRPDDFTIDASGQRAALRFPSVGVPLFILDLTNASIAARLPADLGGLGLLPDGRVLTARLANNRAHFGTVDPLTLAAAPLFSLDYRYQVGARLPQRLGDPILLTTGGRFWLHDLALGKTTREFPLPGRSTDVAIGLRRGDRVTPLVAQSVRLDSDSTQASATFLETVDLATDTLGEPWSMPALPINAFAARADDFEAVIRNGSNVRRVRFTEAGLTVEPLPLPSAGLGTVTPFFDQATSQWQFVGNQFPRLARPTGDDGAYQVSPLGLDQFTPPDSSSPKTLQSTYAFDLARDEQTIALYHFQAVTVTDRTTNRRLAAFPVDTPYAHRADYQRRLALSPDGRTVAWAYTTKTDQGWLDVVECRDVTSGELKWRRPSAKALYVIDHLKFSPDGRLLYLLGPMGNPTGANYFGSLFASTGEVNAEIKSVTAKQIVYNRATTLFADIGTKAITVRTLPAGGNVSSVRLDFQPASLAFIGSDRFLLANSATDETLRLIDLTAGTVVAEISLFDDPAKWLVRNPETGLFSSETSLQDDLRFIQGEQITPLAAYFDEFYRPRLLGSLIKGLSPRPAVPLSDLRYAPKLTLRVDGPSTRGLTVEDEFETLEIPTPEVTLKLDATSEGSPIDDLRIYHNGKLVAGATRGLFVEDDEDAPPAKTFTKTATHTFTLTPGKNRFRAIAINQQGTESVPDEIIVYSNASPPVDDTAGLALHVITVGLNTYQNPAYNLNYARADAQAVEEILRTRFGALFTRANHYALYDAEATRENILATLDTVKREAGPRDVFVFYYAGHGTMSDDDDPEFYLAPFEITQLYGERRVMRQLGIPGRELLAYSRDIAAQKQLFILDACQSAGALKTLAVRGAVEERAIAQLARSTGTHWLTATGSEQFATEFATLGHGAFTKVLLDALAGAADTGDGLVTVNELKAYVEAKVPELTAAAKGEAQYPVTYGYGQDFPLTVVGVAP